MMSASFTTFSQPQRGGRMNTVAPKGKLDFGDQKAASVSGPGGAPLPALRGRRASRHPQAGNPPKVTSYHVLAGSRSATTLLLVSIVEGPIHAVKRPIYVDKNKQNQIIPAMKSKDRTMLHHQVRDTSSVGSGMKLYAALTSAVSSTSSTSAVTSTVGQYNKATSTIARDFSKQIK
ncbi:uncharacterized protein ACIBXB_017667 isoform 1-T1 [Morphnus guianensis]